MVLVCFNEKDEDRYIQGNTLDEVLEQVLTERINGTYASVFGDEDERSIWYGDETETAKLALQNGHASQFMTERKKFDYENWFVVDII